MTMSIDTTSSQRQDDETPAATDGDKSAERTARTQAPATDTGSQPRAETLTREQYADAMRADGGPMPRDNSHDNPEAPEEGPRDQPERQADRDRAEPRDRVTYAAADPAQDRHEAGHQPETITFENKDIEVTRKAADGIWIEGLPGDPPTRIGDLVSSAEDPAQGRGEKLRKELTMEAEDISDTVSEWADHVQEILDNPRPTHSMTHSRPPETAISGTEHGINAGHGAEALLTLTIVGAAAVHKLHEQWQRAWDH